MGVDGDASSGIPPADVKTGPGLCAPFARQRPRSSVASAVGVSCLSSRTCSAPEAPSFAVVSCGARAAHAHTRLNFKQKAVLERRGGATEPRRCSARSIVLRDGSRRTSSRGKQPVCLMSPLAHRRGSIGKTRLTCTTASQHVCAPWALMRLKSKPWTYGDAEACHANRTLGAVREFTSSSSLESILPRPEKGRADTGLQSPQQPLVPALVKRRRQPPASRLAAE